MIALTIQGAKYLVKTGNAWAGQILGAMIKWAKRGDKRFPQATDFIGPARTEVVYEEYKGNYWWDKACKEGL